MNRCSTVIPYRTYGIDYNKDEKTCNASYIQKGAKYLVQVQRPVVPATLDEAVNENKLDFFSRGVIGNHFTSTPIKEARIPKIKLVFYLTIKLSFLINRLKCIQHSLYKYKILASLLSLKKKSQ